MTDKVAFDLTPAEAQAEYGATHYSVTRDGKPMMYYKRETIKFNDGTYTEVWVYLSFADLWMGSNYSLRQGNLEQAERALKEIRPCQKQ